MTDPRIEAIIHDCILDQRIVRKLITRNEHYARLSFYGARFGITGLGRLAFHVAVNNWLTSLDLDSCRIGKQGAGIISKALACNTSLTALQLDSNFLGDEGIEQIAEMLKVNKTLTCIDLDNNEFGYFGAVALSNALKVNMTLKTLCIDNNDIGIGGIEKISDALDVNHTLEEIMIDNGDIHEKLYRNSKRRMYCETILSRLVIGISFVRANRWNDLKYMGLQQFVQKPIVDMLISPSTRDNTVFVSQQSAFSHTKYFLTHV
jgi:hypothetical protein